MSTWQAAYHLHVHLGRTAEQERTLVVTRSRWQVGTTGLSAEVVSLPLEPLSLAGQSPLEQAITVVEAALAALHYKLAQGELDAHA